MATYINKQTGDKVKIIKEEDLFYTLNDGVKIKKETFSNRYERSDEIDPNEFLNPPSALEKLANQLRNVDTSKVINEPEHSTRIKMKPPTVLADNSRTQSPIDNTINNDIQISESKKQQLIDEYNKKMELGEKNINKPSFMIEDDTNNGYIEYEMPNKGEGNIKQTSQQNNQNQNQNQKQNQPQIDPLQMMFKMFKNNYDITLTFEIKEKIANPQFIEMVMENVDGDAIEYYTKKILNKILNEPLKLKNEIYKQLKEEIYGEDSNEINNNEQLINDENSNTNDLDDKKSNTENKD